MTPPGKRTKGAPDVLVPYLRLREEVINGSLPPGSPILETTTSTRFGVGRAVVREAILTLLHDGLLQHGRHGVEVRVRSADEVYEIYQARILLEAEAVEAATRHLSPLDLSRLQHVQERSAIASDPSKVRDWHCRWHRALVLAGRNRTILEILDRLTLQLAPYETTSLAAPCNLETTEADHHRILEAMRVGDAPTARDELISHLQRTRDLRVAALMCQE